MVSRYLVSLPLPFVLSSSHSNSPTHRVDADPAINSMMWQNAGSSGIDQWNFVSSPTSASQDPSGKYTRKWCPELSKLSNKVIHTPWKASKNELEAAGVILGVSYPNRIIYNLKEERAKKTNAVLKMRRKNQNFNDNGGYDLISLPDGTLHRIFTKQEYRIDRSGKLRPPPVRRQKKGKRQKGSRERILKKSKSKI